MSNARNVGSRPAAIEHDAAARDEGPPEIDRSPIACRRHAGELRDHAERHFPAHVAGGEIDRGQRAPRRRIARQPLRGQERLAKHPVRGPRLLGGQLPRPRPPARSARSRSRGMSLTTYGRRFVGAITRPGWIVGDTAPVHAAAEAGKGDRPLDARRCEQPFRAQAGHSHAARLTFGWRDAPGVVGREP